MRDPEGTLREGHKKYPNCFKVATLTGEYIIVNDTERFAEYLAAPDSVLNVQDAINVGIQFQWTMGEGVYHRCVDPDPFATRYVKTMADRRLLTDRIISRLCVASSHRTSQASSQRCKKRSRHCYSPVLASLRTGKRSPYTK